MKYIELLENISSPFDLSIEEDYGTVDGYAIDSDKEQLENWLMHRHNITNPSVLKTIREKYPTIAFLNNINVEEENRGQGNGNSLLEQFISNAFDHGVDAILLIADTAENQIDGFDLVKWYKNYGFNIIYETSSGPLMLLEP